jgi:hypothetical protein
MLLAAAILLPHLVAAPPADSVQLPKPGVQYRTDRASASSRPWVNANGWRLERGSSHPFFYDVTGETTALAVAEAFAYQREAAIHTDAPGTAIFDRMMGFLKSISEGPTTPVANIGVVDDGSAEAGEVMNLLARHNLLFRISPQRDASLPVNIQLGTPEYPKSSAANPEAFAQKVRESLTDEKRSVRLYGSDVVLARVNGDSSRVRIHLINYSERSVYGIRVRVLGSYPKNTIAAFAGKNEVQDYDARAGVTEFTLPELKRYAVVDLSSR